MDFLVYKLSVAGGVAVARFWFSLASPARAESLGVAARTSWITTICAWVYGYLHASITTNTLGRTGQLNAQCHLGVAWTLTQIHTHTIRFRPGGSSRNGTDEANGSGAEASNPSDATKDRYAEDEARMGELRVVMTRQPLGRRGGLGSGDSALRVSSIFALLA